MCPAACARTSSRAIRSLAVRSARARSVTSWNLRGPVGRYEPRRAGSFGELEERAVNAVVGQLEREPAAGALPALVGLPVVGVLVGLRVVGEARGGDIHRLLRTDRTGRSVC